MTAPEASRFHGKTRPDLCFNIENQTKIKRRWTVQNVKVEILAISHEHEKFPGQSKGSEAEWFNSISVVFSFFKNGLTIKVPL